MMNKNLVLMVVLLVSCQSEYAESIDLTAYLKDHVKILASDEYEGRATGTEGETLAANYIMEQFNTLSLVPCGDRKGFVQSFPILENELDPFNSFLSVENTRFKYGTDIIRIGGGGTFKAQRLNSGLIVVNGITDTLTPAEKVLIKNSIVLYNPPSEKGKLTMDARRFMFILAGYGPASILVATDKDESKWQQYKPESNLKTTQQAAWPMWLDNKKETTHISFFEVNEQVLNQVGLRRSDGNQFNILRLDTKIEVDVNTRPTRLIFGKNIVGYIAGTDLSLARQPIIVSAHYDGLGVSTFQNLEDRVHNGADDNASGVAALIEIARMFAGSKPRHPIIFLATSGEEKGLWGSNYFINKFPLPMLQPIANINIDMIGTHYRDGSMYIIGQHELEELNVFDDSRLKLLSDHAFELDFPKEHMYYRSDQINFVEQNIPAVLMTSSGLPDHYHEINDEYAVIDFDHLNDATHSVYQFLLKIDRGQLNLTFKRPVEAIIRNWHLAADDPS